MKQLIITIAALLLLPLTVTAQYEEDTENGVVSLNGKEGLQSLPRRGISFSNLICWSRPVLTSTTTTMKAGPGLQSGQYTQQRFLDPLRHPRFHGQGIRPGDIQPLHQCRRKRRKHPPAGLVRRRDEKSFAIRVGKFKTPFSHAYLTTLGETLMPTLRHRLPHPLSCLILLMP